MQAFLFRMQVCCLEIGAHNVAQAVLEFVICLPVTLDLWDYKYMPPCLAARDMLKKETTLN